MKSEIKVGDNRLEIARIFDAPRQLVFAFWKQVEGLEKWWACKDTTSVQCQMDFCVGGFFTCVMQIKGAGEFTYKGQYDEIVGFHDLFYPALDALIVAGILRDRIVDGRVHKIYLYVFPAMIFLQVCATYLERVNPSWWQAATKAILGA